MIHLPKEWNSSYRPVDFAETPVTEVLLNPEQA
jgi:hypothetical protein